MCTLSSVICIQYCLNIRRAAQVHRQAYRSVHVTCFFCPRILTSIDTERLLITQFRCTASFFLCSYLAACAATHPSIIFVLQTRFSNMQYHTLVATGLSLHIITGHIEFSTCHHCISQNIRCWQHSPSPYTTKTYAKFSTTLHHIPQPTCQVQRCPSLYTTKLCTARHPVPQAIYVNPSKAYNHIPQSHICLFQQCVFTTCHNKATCQWQHCIWPWSTTKPHAHSIPALHLVKYNKAPQKSHMWLVRCDICWCGVCLVTYGQRVVCFVKPSLHAACSVYSQVVHKHTPHR